MAKKNKNKKKNKNPNKSWRKFDCETWFQYINRILTYNRLQVILMVITLLFTILSYVYLIKPPGEIVVLKKDIENHLATIENTISREKVMMDNDSAEYNKLINNFKIDILDYIGLFKAVSNSELSEDFADLKINKLVNILQNELERRKQLNVFTMKLFEDVKAIKIYELLTDTSYVTKVSEEKQTKMIGLLKEKVQSDSLYNINIGVYLQQANSDYSNNFNYKKDLRKAIREMKKMTKTKLWYKVHKNIMEFIIETNNLFEISKRKYSSITPYKYLEDVMTNESSQTDTIDREIIKQQLLQILNKDNNR